MNGDSTLLVTVFIFAVLVFEVLLWFEIPWRLRGSTRRLRSMTFLVNFYHCDLKEVNRLIFFFSSHRKQTLMLERWLSSHLDIATLAILDRNTGYPFDPSSMSDYSMTLAEKKRRTIPEGYEGLWVWTGVKKAQNGLLNPKSEKQVSVA